MSKRRQFPAFCWCCLCWPQRRFGTDNVSFLKWWLMTLVLGIDFIRLPQRCFRGFMTGDGCFFLQCLARCFRFCCICSWKLRTGSVYRTGLPDHSRCTDPGFLIFGCFKVRVHAPEIDFLMMEEVLFSPFSFSGPTFAGFHPEAPGTENSWIMVL